MGWVGYIHIFILVCTCTSKYTIYFYKDNNNILVLFVVDIERHEASVWSAHAHTTYLKDPNSKTNLWMGKCAFATKMLFSGRLTQSDRQTQIHNIHSIRLHTIYVAWTCCCPFIVCKNSDSIFINPTEMTVKICIVCVCCVLCDVCGLWTLNNDHHF